MKAVVIYESMYGNTHLIANAIAEGLRKHGEAIVVPVDEADAALVGNCRSPRRRWSDTRPRNESRQHPKGSSRGSREAGIESGHGR